jgi:uncharacterized protein (DUF983 family)
VIAAVINIMMPPPTLSATEQHEQAAQVAFAGVLIVGVAALGGLIFFRRDKAIPNWLAIIVLVLSAIVFALMVRTPSLGGLIRHTGIRADVHAAMINDEKPD